MRAVKGPSPSMSRSLNTTSLSGVLTCAGTWVSPSITWFVREWCTACDRCHEKYGTRSNEWRMYPTVSWMARLSEKAPWPHSCATTQHPVLAVPATKAYAIHAGR